MAAVTVTITSSVSFQASVLGRPVIVTGCTDTYNKEFTYECFDPEKLEETIKQAMREGVTEHMKEMLVRFIAQMLKYYLYDDNRPREIRYGRSIEQFELAEKWMIA